ncbi:MAG TPA: 3-phosphoshikimate 1-carboxyvinyltransferase [Allosphingosinicella sp.]|nr:3-phosphoshikimate 1-carboxyvinyltransferase [Allosphingosinicella sp.]
MSAPAPLRRAFAPLGPLVGTAPLPGDKSISHRALILAALAVGRSRIEGLCDGSDLAATAVALSAMGARIELGADGAWAVDGVGVGGLLQPDRPLDMGNSGTSARLLAGLVAGHPIRAVLTGDSSLQRRPMDRVAEPLRRLGARIDGAPGGRLPLVVTGASPLLPGRHRLELPSAQVKSALLLAGLNAPGITELTETVPTRDHLERMLALFGADIETGGGAVRLRGEAELRPQRLAVPGDSSAAAFLAVAALVVPGSELRIEGMVANPRRTGLFRLLAEMGADIRIEGRRMLGAEEVADLTVRHSALSGIDVPPAIVADAIDEFPILFVAAAFARGATRTRGLAELRVKESDRLRAMAAGLAAIGVRVEEAEDGLVVHGGGGAPVAGGATVAACLDHRVAMSFAVAGLHAGQPIGIDDMSSVLTSFPGFVAALDSLAGR